MTTRAAQRRGVAHLAVAAVLFSLMALSAKKASARLPGPEVAFLRFVVGLLAGGLEIARGRRLHPHSLWSLFLRGAFGGSAVLLYFLAIARLPVGVATLLNYSSPLFTVLFSALFLGERLGRNTALALLLASTGVVLVVQGGWPQGFLDPGHLPWVLAGIGSAVLSGAAVTTIRAMRQQEGSWEIFLAFCLIGALMTVAPTAAAWVRPAGRDWSWVVLMGLASVAAQIFMTHALRDVRAATAGLVLQLTPASTFVLGMTVLGDRPTMQGLLGTAVTLLGVSWGIGWRQVR